MFDPGTNDRGETWDQEELRMIRDMLHLRFPEYSNRGVASIRKGVIRENGIEVTMGKVLFDSGALQSSYISRDLVDKNRDAWKGKIVRHKGLVRLGDNQTTKEVNERITLRMEFEDANQTQHAAEVTAWIFDMPGLDAIIGLPDIIESYLEYFIEFLRTSKERTYNGIFALDASEDLGSRYPDLMDPWTI